MTNYYPPQPTGTSQPVFKTDASGNPLTPNADAITLISQTTAASGTYVSGDQTNGGARGVKVYLNISAIGASVTVTATVQGKDPVTNTYYTLLASAAKAATGFTVLTVYPGLTAAANTVASDVLPRTWNVSVAVVDTTGTPTFTVSCSYLP